MKEIKYIKGDATSPQGNDNKIVCHVCNDKGGWGRGFVLALSKKWKEPEVQYRKWSKGYIRNIPFELGQVLFVKVEPNIAIANMVGQHDTVTVNNVPPVRYDAINKCLEKVAEVAKKNNASIHCPRFGAGLAGGRWEEIERLIVKNLSEKDIQVTVYDL